MNAPGARTWAITNASTSIAMKNSSGPRMKAFGSTSSGLPEKRSITSTSRNSAFGRLSPGTPDSKL